MRFYESLEYKIQWDRIQILRNKTGPTRTKLEMNCNKTRTEQEQNKNWTITVHELNQN